MEYKTRAAIIGRKKREKETDEVYPCFISLFSIDNPHTSGKVPDQILEFKKTHKVIITGLDLIYLLGGNDLVINSLKEITITDDRKGHLYITGKQEQV